VTAVLRLVPGTGGSIGLTVDGRAVPLGTGEYVDYRWGLAPAGVATFRQLGALRLRPGGADPVARLVWRRGQRWAYLYAVEAAKPKRTPTPAQLAALDAAMRARRTCTTCRRDVGYCLPRTWTVCLDCQDVTDTTAAADRVARAA